MLRIPCPFCGERDEIEFRYRGAVLARPNDSTDVQAFVRFVYERENPAGWHLEWWLHTGGCRRLLVLRRHTLTHEIAAVVEASPGADASAAESG